MDEHYEMLFAYIDDALQEARDTQSWNKVHETQLNVKAMREAQSVGSMSATG